MKENEHTTIEKMSGAASNYAFLHNIERMGCELTKEGVLTVEIKKQEYMDELFKVLIPQRELELKLLDGKK